MYLLFCAWTDRPFVNFQVCTSSYSLLHAPNGMSSSGPSADAKQAQAAALAELETAQRKKRALDGQLVGVLHVLHVLHVLPSGPWVALGWLWAPVAACREVLALLSMLGTPL